MPMRLSKGMWSFLCNRRIISSDRRINGDILVFQSRGGIVLSQKFRMSRLFSRLFSLLRAHCLRLQAVLTRWSNAVSCSMLGDNAFSGEVARVAAKEVSTVHVHIQRRRQSHGRRK